MSESAAEEGLVVFDLDGTLVRENTMYGFLAYLFQGDRRRSAFFRLSHALPGKAVWAVLDRLGVADYRRVALRTLEGVAEDEVRAAAKRYAAEVLPQRDLPEIMARLAAARDAGRRVVLASGTLAPVAHAFARRHGVADVVASVPEVEDGRLTGRLADDVAGRKLAALRAAGWTAPLAEVVTDNLDDLDLIRAAEAAVIVVKRGRSRRWEGRLDARATLVEV